MTSNYTTKQCFTCNNTFPNGEQSSDDAFSKLVQIDNNGLIDEPISLNSSSNVLLVYRLQEMRGLASLNFSLATLCLAYCGINVTLTYVNYVNPHAEKNGEVLPVSELTFHLIEFWATFGFAVIECVSLVNTPKSILKIYNNPLFLKVILFINIIATLVPALLVSLDLEIFEILSHEIEYVNELTMSFVDLVLLWSLCHLSNAGASSSGNFPGLVGTTMIACFVAVAQLLVYNWRGRRPDGKDMYEETPAHFFEFAFEIISSIIAFWFCMDNKFVADKEIGLILYGKHDDCYICGEKSNEFRKTYQNDPFTSSSKKIGSTPSDITYCSI